MQRIDRVSMNESFQHARTIWGRGTTLDRDREISETETLDLAQRGLLLSYVLNVGGKRCEVAFGTRVRDTLVCIPFGTTRRSPICHPGPSCRP